MVRFEIKEGRGSLPGWRKGNFTTVTLEDDYDDTFLSPTLGVISNIKLISESRSLRGGSVVVMYLQFKANGRYMHFLYYRGFVPGFVEGCSRSCTGSWCYKERPTACIKRMLHKARCVLFDHAGIAKV